METRCNNLVYEHRHDHYRWHANTVEHRKIAKKPCEVNICIVCHVAKPDMQFDEFLGGYVCKVCDTEREIGVLKR